MRKLHIFFLTIITSFIFASLILPTEVHATLLNYPAPSGAPLSPKYTATINNQPIAVYDSRRNQHSGSNDQTDIIYFDSDEPVTLSIQATGTMHSGIIRPRRQKIVPYTINGSLGSSTFTLTEPGYYIFNEYGSYDLLIIFFNPLETDAPDPNDPNVIYYGPGIYETNPDLQSGQTLYIAGGAIVRGHIKIHDATNVKVKGRGLLDGFPFTRNPNIPLDSNDLAIDLKNSQNVELEGIIVVDHPSWTVVPYKSSDINIKNLKLISRNSDGFDISSSQRVTIDGCFVDTWDDAIALKAHAYFEQSNYQGDVKDIIIQNCVLRSGVSALEIGYETNGNYFENILFKNIDILGYGPPGFGSMHNGNYATVRNVRYENINIEGNGGYIVDLQNLVSGWGGTGAGTGRIKDIYYKDVSIYAPFANSIRPSQIFGLSPEYNIDGITFENLKFNDTYITSAQQGNFEINQYASNVNFVVSTPSPSTASSCKADLNQDLYVDLSDYSIIAANFLSSPPADSRADINTDGIVDLSDYSILASTFLNSCEQTGTGTSATPSPTHVGAVIPNNSLITNGGFESGFSGWNNTSSSVISLVQGDAAEGNYAMRSTGDNLIEKNNISVTPGKTYLVTAYFKWNNVTDNGWGSPRIGITNNSWQTLIDATGLEQIYPKGVWNKLSLLVTPQVSSINILLGSWGQEDVIDILFDGISIVPVN